MPAPPLPGVLAALAPLLDHYGYLAIGGLVLLEGLGVLVPGETVLIAGAVYAGAGRLNIVAVGVIAVAAAILGDNIGYLIGRLGGRALVLRWGKYVLLTGERLDKAEEFFTRHSGWGVTIARFLEVLRQANAIIAGITGMPWRLFLAYNALAPRCGWRCGPAWATWSASTSPPSTPTSPVTPCTCSSRSGVAILALIGRRLARRRAAPDAPADRGPASQAAPAAEDSRRR
jgi:membrane protein DedA with SNARE-associated domain